MTNLSLLIALLLCSPVTYSMSSNQGTEALEPVAHKFVESVFQEEEHVLKTQAEWNSFWKRFSLKESPRITDFNLNDVVVFLMGTKGSGGFSTKLESVTNESDHTLIKVLKCIPKEGVPQVAELTSPYAIKIVPNITRKVKWQKRQGTTGTHDCN